MDTRLIVAGVILLVAIAAPGVLSLDCYNCKYTLEKDGSYSGGDKSCIDPSGFTDEEKKSKVKTCVDNQAENFNILSFAASKGKTMELKCMKRIRTGESGNQIVSRQCAFVEKDAKDGCRDETELEREYEKAKTNDPSAMPKEVQVCQCDDDLCNTGSGVNFSVLTVVVTCFLAKLLS
jgi:hypothetical protein